MKQQIAELQEKLDRLQVIIWDKDEALQKCRGELSETTRTLAARESTIVNYVQQYKELDKRRMEEEKKSVELQADKAAAEHLAKKAIKLQEDNIRLINENVEFKKQTTRLIVENSQLCCPGARMGEVSSMCGGCTSCLLKQAYHTMDEMEKKYADLVHERDGILTDKNLLESVLESRCRMIDGYEYALARISQLCSRWFGKKRIKAIAEDALNKGDICRCPQHNETPKK